MDLFEDIDFASFGNDNHVQDVVAYIFIRSMVTPINKTAAYKNKFVDEQGFELKEPKTKADHKVYTILDKTVFKLKRVLGSRINELAPFFFLTAYDGGLEKYLTVKGGSQNRASVKLAREKIRKMK